jgi:UDPglucose 6-dehydrogenase
MKIAMIGTGYVGLVAGTCLANRGNSVTCVDIDEDKIKALNQGECPIFEPGLPELMASGVKSGHLTFSTDLPAAVRGADVVFLAVCTPQRADGGADISQVWNATEQIAPHLGPNTVVALKSTAPAQTVAIMEGIIKKTTARFGGVVYIPEFLREGSAVHDFMHPDRVVVGTNEETASDVMFELLHPFLRCGCDYLVMTPESAAMVKYASNAMLATKISFINEIANICERVGANIDDVKEGMCKDKRIGSAFLNPGVGYGGSCFPKDVVALAYEAHCQGIDPKMLNAVNSVNENQKDTMAMKLAKHFKDPIFNKVVAIWGLAFKPNTDDVREAPALTLIDTLLTMGATIRVHDPKATDNVRKLYGDALQYGNKYEILRGADVLVINTEWIEYLFPDFSLMERNMKDPVIFDGRNIFHHSGIKGFEYHSVGRPTTYREG